MFLFPLQDLARKGLKVSYSLGSASETNDIHWGLNKKAEILQTAYSNVFCGMKIMIYWLKFHWSLFLRTNEQQGNIGLINTLRLRQNVHHFADNHFKRIFLNENIWI